MREFECLRIPGVVPSDLDRHQDGRSAYPAITLRTHSQAVLLWKPGAQRTTMHGEERRRLTLFHYRVPPPKESILEFRRVAAC